MIFNNIKISNWNQFDHIDINLHPRLTVITGANGAGKSSILRILSRFIGWNTNETAIPLKKIKSVGLGYRLGGKRKINEENSLSHSQLIQIGNITLSTGQVIAIQVPELSPQANYGMSLNPHISLSGLNIPSHRSPYTYRPITSIPVKAHTRHEAFSMFNNALMNRTLGNYFDPPSQQMKATLISLALFGKGNEYVQENQEALDLFTGFIEILKVLLPKTLGFENISVRNGEVLLETRSGDFLLDAVSGGIGAILDLAWQIFMFKGSKVEPFFVLIDEAENHLHASMQRELLPNLIKSFPNAQFIVTTHSPLLVNSVKDSLIYVLKYNEDNAVVSQLLDFVNKSANASQILREVLGVPVTLPVWVEEQLNSIVSEFQGKNLDPENYKKLKMELAAIGMADHLPNALGMIHGGNGQ
jgi:predicted ATPase